MQGASLPADHFPNCPPEGVVKRRTLVDAGGERGGAAGARTKLVSQSNSSAAVGRNPLKQYKNQQFSYKFHYFSIQIPSSLNAKSIILNVNFTVQAFAELHRPDAEPPDTWLISQHKTRRFQGEIHHFPYKIHDF